jgi:hypothetical protein
MARRDRQRSEGGAAPTGQGAKPEQGVYGSGGSYGVGGGFDEEDPASASERRRDSGTRDDADAQRLDQAARSEAQQEAEQRSGFEREVDADAAPPSSGDEPRSAQEEALAAKKRRGSRV